MKIIIILISGIIITILLFIIGVINTDEIIECGHTICCW